MDRQYSESYILLLHNVYETRRGKEDCANIACRNSACYLAGRKLVLKQTGLSICMRYEPNTHKKVLRKSALASVNRGAFQRVSRLHYLEITDYSRFSTIPIALFP